MKTCPACGLRFALETELEWHLAEDHDKEWAGSDKRYQSAEHDTTAQGDDR